tara:strand:- start:1839 stop:2072 length:234 start_codon:yes stop_codon:yes gene_type:complete
MQLTSKYGSVVIDYYPIKSWVDNNIRSNKKLKVLSFKGDVMRKMIISITQMNTEIEERVKDYDYIITNAELGLPQYV